MKKFLACFLAVLFTLSLAACGGNEESDKDQSSIGSAVELLTTVWNSYGEDDKFPSMGGDFSEENMTNGAPGKYGIDDADALDNTLGLPAASAGKIDDAASLVHMMNANTFTCGAFHVKNADDIAATSTAIKDNLMQRQWTCGFPDKLVIVKVDNYIVSFFGNEEIVDKFYENLTTAYPSAEKLCDEPL